jgi:hypothetical protein
MQTEHVPSSKPSGRTRRAPRAGEAAAAPATLDLDALTRMSVAELDALYAGGGVPDTLAALDGAPRSRMLAVVGLDRGPVAGAIRRLAASGSFPWAGKRFAADGDEAGGGINRIRLLGERQWYPFTTRVEPSVVDGAPCIVLDYDRPDNPWFIRRIRDELREVAPALFLGPALLASGERHRLLVYFAIDKQ